MIPNPPTTSGGKKQDCSGNPGLQGDKGGDRGCGCVVHMPSSRRPHAEATSSSGPHQLSYRTPYSPVSAFRYGYTILVSTRTRTGRGALCDQRACVYARTRTSTLQHK
eukprot:scaffold542006_cov50-Prasinocladus_malaysianus.AAC.1